MFSYWLWQVEDLSLDDSSERLLARASQHVHAHECNRVCGVWRLRGILESLLYLRLTPSPRQHPRTRVANICQLLQRHICYHEAAVTVILPTTVCKVAAIHSSEASEGQHWFIAAWRAASNELSAAAAARWWTLPPPAWTSASDIWIQFPSNLRGRLCCN